MNDWTGNAKSVFTCNGARNFATEERHSEDYYATEPKALEVLLEHESFGKTVWEPAVGGGHLAEVLKSHGHNVICSDITDRGYPDTEIIDFLKDGYNMGCDIITNPPYKFAKEFVEQAINLVGARCKVAMFLKLTFLESKKRRELFDKYPPKIIYVSSGRLQCAKNGDFSTYKKGVGTAVAYAWFVWEDGWHGEPVVRWIN